VFVKYFTRILFARPAIALTFCRPHKSGLIFPCFKVFLEAVRVFAAATYKELKIREIGQETQELQARSYDKNIQVKRWI
jgi:hypothetical protein